MRLSSRLAWVLVLHVVIQRCRLQDDSPEDPFRGTMHSPLCFDAIILCLYVLKLWKFLLMEFPCSFKLRVCGLWLCS